MQAAVQRIFSGDNKTEPHSLELQARDQGLFGDGLKNWLAGFEKKNGKQRINIISVDFAEQTGAVEVAVARSIAKASSFLELRADTDSDTETETETENGAEAEAETEADAEAESKSESETQARALIAEASAAVGSERMLGELDAHADYTDAGVKV